MEYLSVTEVTEIIAERIEGDPYLTDIGVVGEVVNVRFRENAVFFNVVDERSKLPCVVFGKRYTDLKDGEVVRLFGSVRVYRKGGYYSFNVEHVERVGVKGSKSIGFERIFRKLFEEGILPKEKRLIEGLPSKIGVITSRYSAAFRDILSVFESKDVAVRLFLFHTRIQGDGAVRELVKAFESASRLDLDALIVARGGGSSEELWVFNDYEVLKAAANIPFPIITGIGHSIDSVLMDEIADYVMITPTSAAELVAQIHVNYREKLEELDGRLENAFRSVLQRVESKLVEFEARLESSAPENILKRGFALLRLDGEFIKSVEDVEPGEELEILMKDGILRVMVREVGRYTERTRDDRQGA